MRTLLARLDSIGDVLVTGPAARAAAHHSDHCDPWADQPDPALLAIRMPEVLEAASRALRLTPPARARPHGDSGG